MFFRQVRFIFQSFLIFLVMCSCAYRMGNIYRVKAGDTLIHVAHVQNITIEELLAANPRIRSNELIPGQGLLIPGSQLKKDPIATVDVGVSEETQEKISLTSSPKAKNTIEELPVSPLVTTKAKEVSIAQEVSPTKPLPKKVESVSEIKPLKAKVESPIFSWPLKGKVLSNFGKRNEKMHNGIDIQGKPKDSIACSEDGSVAFRGSSVEGYGTMLIVKHSGNFYSIYAYLGDVLVKHKDIVKKGQVIASVSKDKDQSFFHFEIRSGKAALDPLKLLPKL